VDSLITIPNEKLLTVLGKGVSLLEAFKAANNVLLGAVQGISDLITCPGLINVDFADVRTVMAEMGMAMMGTGKGSGEDRARLAAEAAVASPLLDDINLRGARGVLVNITAGADLSIGEFEEVGNIIKEYAADTATVVVGTVIENDLNDEMRVTVVATGLGQENVKPHIVVDNHPSHRERHHSPEQQPQRAGGNRRVAGGGGLSVVQNDSNNMDYLDIPAFLRRQSD
jgi:cell division protein FtsZ